MLYPITKYWLPLPLNPELPHSPNHKRSLQEDPLTSNNHSSRSVRYLVPPFIRLARYVCSSGPLAYTRPCNARLTTGASSATESSSRIDLQGKRGCKFTAPPSWGIAIPQRSLYTGWCSRTLSWFTSRRAKTHTGGRSYAYQLTTKICLLNIFQAPLSSKQYRNQVAWQKYGLKSKIPYCQSILF